MTKDKAKENKKEASRLATVMSQRPYFYGTCSAAVVDCFVEEFGTSVFCNGDLRNVVFTPITSNSYSFKTEAFKDPYEQTKQGDKHDYNLFK